MPPEKIVILFNPSAGKGKACRKKERLESLLRQYGISYELFVTRSEKELRELTRAHLKSRKFIVGAGGDSTFHIMVNEIKETGSDAVFGMIALGSSNDIAKEFHLDHLDKACEALKRRNIREIDLGCIVRDNSVLRYFIGQANVGLGVSVNKYVEEKSGKRLKLWQNQTLTGALGIIHSYISHEIPLDLEMESGKDKIKGQFALAVFSNIRYWATGKKINPGARPDDGQLDCCLIRKCSFPRITRLVFLSEKGRHVKAGEVENLRSPGFEVSSEKGFAIQTDGEIIGGYDRPEKFQKIQFRIVPQALNIIC